MIALLVYQGTFNSDRFLRFISLRCNRIPTPGPLLLWITAKFIKTSGSLMPLWLRECYIKKFQYAFALTS